VRALIYWKASTPAVQKANFERRDGALNQFVPIHDSIRRHQQRALSQFMSEMNAAILRRRLVAGMAVLGGVDGSRIRDFKRRRNSRAFRRPPPTHASIRIHITHFCCAGWEKCFWLEPEINFDVTPLSHYISMIAEKRTRAGPNDRLKELQACQLSWFQRMQD
jgi:hypothetical protein